MSGRLRVSLGQHSDKGRKEVNQDFHGACIPDDPLLGSKGICVALADGISSSGVSQVASESAVKAFLEDYYCTSEAWSVRTAAERVLDATNSWLYSQTRRSQFRYDQDKGYVCTFSGMVLKSATAHLFHVGDARIYRLEGAHLEQLTEDHRLRVSDEATYLSRALGFGEHLQLDYLSLPVEQGELFVFATDGVYEHASEQEIVGAIRAQGADLDAAARAIVAAAHKNGSPDNLTVQLVRVDELPSRSANEIVEALSQLPFAPELRPGMSFEGYRIVREIHASHRSHVYLAVGEEDGAQVAIKVPSVDLRDDPAYLERFLLEEWIARRIDNPHVLGARSRTRPRGFVYIVTEYIEGQTLAQWMRDHPGPDVETVRRLIEQLAAGLQAFHRHEMLHQDLRPENVMLNRFGTVKIIDFGSVRVAGIDEMRGTSSSAELLGTLPVFGPGVSARRGRRAAVGRVLPRRHRLPDALRAPSVRGPVGASPHARSATPPDVHVSPRRDPRDPCLGRRRLEQGRPPRSRQALRRAVGARVRPAPPQRGVPQPDAPPAPRPRPGGLLEGRLAPPRRRRRDPAPEVGRQGRGLLLRGAWRRRACLPWSRRRTRHSRILPAHTRVARAGSSPEPRG